jgi:hypothetical protein
MSKNYKKAFYELVNRIGEEQSWNKEDTNDPHAGLFEEGFDLACERLMEAAENILNEC